MKTITIEEPQLIDDIIRRCDTCFVGFVDMESNPYVLPMSFGYEAGVLYFHSSSEGGVQRILQHNSRVCITFSPAGRLVYRDEQVACSYSMRADSVVCRGQAVFIDDLEEKRRALTILMHNYTEREFRYNEPAVRNVCVWKVIVEQRSAKSFGLAPIKKDSNKHP